MVTTTTTLPLDLAVPHVGRDPASLVSDYIAGDQEHWRSRFYWVEVSIRDLCCHLEMISGRDEPLVAEGDHYLAPDAPSYNISVRKSRFPGFPAYQRETWDRVMMELRRTSTSTAASPVAE